MTYKLLAGGYTDGGLYSLSFDAANKKLKLGESRIPAGSNPSWIATHPSDNTVVFATNEVDDGRVLAIKLAGMDASDGVTGEPVKNVSSGGACPAHLLVTKDAIVPGNYMGGSILNVPYSVSPLSLADTSKERKEGDFVQFNGTGPNADRQEASHPHEVYAYENELLIPDLGADKTWRLTKGAAGWDLKDSIDYPAGSGPRHVLIHGGTFPQCIASVLTIRLPRWLFVYRIGTLQSVGCTQICCASKRPHFSRDFVDVCVWQPG